MSVAYAGVLLYRGANQRYTTHTQGFTAALHLLSVLSLVRPHMLACLFSQVPLLRASVLATPCYRPRSALVR